MQNEIKIIVNNKAYSEIKEISVVKDLDYLSGSFECSLANRFVARSPINIEDQIEIQIGSDSVLLGFIDKVNSSVSNSSHDYLISGNDSTSDIEMTEISVNATYNFKKLSSLCEKVLNDNDIYYISVTDESGNTGDDLTNTEQSGDTGQSIFDFLSGYAEKARKVLTSNGEGGLVIYSNAGINKGVVLDATSEKNKVVKASSLMVDYSNRYQKIIVKSQGLDLEDGGEDVTGEATDSVVKRNINRVIINDSVSDKETLQKIAEFEVNKRRSDSVQYNCTVFGFYAENGELWRPNLLVSIIDENHGIRATMLLKTVRYNFNQTGGSTCGLTFVSEDTYSLRTEASSFNEGVE